MHLSPIDPSPSMSGYSHASESLLGPMSFAGLRLAIGKIIYWHYNIFRAGKHRRTVLERIAGMPLLVMPGVQNPRLMRTGAFFSSQLHTGLIQGGAEVLDMGTGSGVCAIAAARRARRVVAIDIDQTAVRCARANVLLNKEENRIEVLAGDLFAPLAGQRFDVVLFNPPFLRGTPRNEADRAWRSTDVAERFAAGLRAHLRPRGYALVLLSSYGHPDSFLQEFRRQRMEVAVAAERRFVNEKLAILQVA
jgi:release factor glutamine methyltransferase